MMRTITKNLPRNTRVDEKKHDEIEMRTMDPFNKLCPDELSQIVSYFPRNNVKDLVQLSHTCQKVRSQVENIFQAHFLNGTAPEVPAWTVWKRIFGKTEASPSLHIQTFIKHPFCRAANLESLLCTQKDRDDIVENPSHVLNILRIREFLESLGVEINAMGIFDFVKKFLLCVEQSCENKGKILTHLSCTEEELKLFLRLLHLYKENVEHVINSMKKYRYFYALTH